eukprot:TRINITY_DN325_c0_g1_i1.p1 TRINITY_DN325_c0_g1~~TRINITY_DN325_c0_g1_i1.p1  ORF type:complete len:541 (+),score=123.64 TRINITY_DN325_c0_g1_i1:81-1625(+)
MDNNRFLWNILLGFLLITCFITGTSGLDCSRCPPLTCEMQEPPTLRSVNGVLSVVLETNLKEVCIGNLAIHAIVFNDSYVPPIFRVNPGDRIELLLINNLPTADVTNTHFHGLNIPPSGSGDDVLIHIDPGHQHQYNFTVPYDQHAGLHWYHSHAHGYAQAQVLSGLSGGLVVDGILKGFPPELQNATQKIFLMKETPLGVNNTIKVKVLSNNHTIATVNGQENPIIRMKPGEVQFWRFAGISSDRYFNLTFGSNFTFHQIATDGNLLRKAIRTDHLDIEPGGRREAFVYGPPPGTYEIVAQYVLIQPEGGFYYSKVIATVISEGQVPAPISIPLNGSAYEHHNPDLRDGLITRKRNISFSGGSGAFFIDDKTFDIRRTDVAVTLGDIEEWTIINHSTELHTFHIHQMSFQVTAKDGISEPFMGWQDSVNIPYSIGTNTTPRNVTVLIPFTDPKIVGRFVFHCHIMFHEDRGMMAVIQVLPEGVSLVQEVSGSIPLQTWISFLIGCLFVINFTQ